MNIYALEGHIVVCDNLSNGYDSDRKIAEEYLNIGTHYTIEATQVESWYTDVWLKEIPDVKFSSVFFEDVTEQSEEMDKEHPDYILY